MELYNNCTWTVDWSVKGLTKNGYNVTGPNGKSIYIPVSGYMLDDIVNGKFLFYCLMSASLGKYYSETASIMCSIVDDGAYWYRYYGYNVRPVRSKNVNQINDAINDENDSIKAIYDIRGNKRSNLQKGINIVVYHNGTSRKVIK